MDEHYCCGYCQKPLASQQLLRLHKKIVHGIVESPITISVAKFKEPCSGIGLGRLISPCFLKEPSEAIVTEGNPHQFECQVYGNPQPSVSWFKDDICIDDSTDYSMICNNGVCILRIEEAATDYEATYTCRAENEAGQVDRCAKLQVLTSLSPAKPYFVTPLSNVTVRAGHKLCLECVITGETFLEVKWLCNSKNEGNKSINETGHAQLSFDGRKATLVIKEAFQKDAGIYTIVAKNINGEAVSTCSVSIEDTLPWETCDSEMAFTAKSKAPQAQQQLLIMPTTGVNNHTTSLECDNSVKRLKSAAEPPPPQTDIMSFMIVPQLTTYIVQYPGGIFMPYQPIPQISAATLVPTNAGKTVVHPQRLLQPKNGVPSLVSNAPVDSIEIEPKTFQCSYCEILFSHRHKMKLHQKEAHASLLPCYECQICKKDFTHRISLQRHKKKMHSEAVLGGKGSSGLFLCQEEDCGQLSFRFASELRNHLTDKHDLTFHTEELEFARKDEFFKWKEKIEHENMAFYRLNGGQCIRSIGVVRYYCCNRSGKYESQSKGMRFVKQSARIGFNCTSSIKTVENLNTGEIKVTFYERHYGHTFSFRHIRLAETERLSIAKKIRCKGSLKEVLNDIRGPHGTTPLKRLHFTTMKDIQNIKHAYNLKHNEPRDDDPTSPRESVELPTNNFSEVSQENPILCSKFQGETLDEFDKDEVFFVIQLPLQKQILNKYGNSAICTDSTHRTNSSNFIVITLLVIDKFQQGFPVAWCVANRQDSVVLKKFIEVIKDNGNDGLQPQYFVSDLEPAFYQAWTEVYGTSTQKLIATYHLHKALSNQLQILIPEKSLMDQVEKALHELIEEPDIGKFEELLKSFVEDLDSCQGTEDFAEYFKNSYGSHVHEWAHCYRIGSGLTTANYMESFRKSFKDIYGDGKVNQRLDKLLHFLTHVAYNKAVDKMIRQEKGLSCRATQKIAKCHRSSLKLDLNSVIQVPDIVGQYMVNSESENQQYQVEITTDPCRINCAIKCSKCSVCIHQVKCTCVDFLTHSNICKHVHLTCRFIKTVHLDISQQSNTDLFDTEGVLEDIAKGIEINSLRDEISNQLQYLQQKLDTSDVNTSEFLKVKEVLHNAINA